MSILNNIQGSGFKAPDNYFNSLEAKICDKTFNNYKLSETKVPEGYFDGLEDKIMKAISEESVLDQQIDSGLKVPDGYLNTIENSILDKINTKVEAPKVIPLFTKQNILYATSIAAALVLMFSFYFKNEDTTFENIDVELVENYILDQNIDSYELASLLKDEDLQTVNFLDSDVYNDDSLEEYLIDNADIEELINN